MVSPNIEAVINRDEGVVEEEKEEEADEVDDNIAEDENMMSAGECHEEGSKRARKRDIGSESNACKD